MFLVQYKRGFTLIEVLVVIAIIGILATVVLGSLSGARDKGLVANAQSQLKEIEKAMLLVHADTGFYPSADAMVIDYCVVPGSDNEVAASAPESGLVTNGHSWPNWNGPYIQVPLDPWGTPYYFDSDYECQGGEEGCGGTTDTISAILSCGPDGLDGGSGGSCVYNEDNILLRLCASI